MTRITASIIGAGSVGLGIAASLAVAGQRVTLLARAASATVLTWPPRTSACRSFACRVRRKLVALPVMTGGVGVLGRHTDEERMLAELLPAMIGGKSAGRAPAPA